MPCGYFGGWVDIIISRIIELVGIPSIVLILALMAVIETDHLAYDGHLGFTSWTGMARLTRAEFLKLKESGVAAAIVVTPDLSGLCSGISCPIR